MREDESMLIEGTVGPWRRYALDLSAIRVFSKGMGVRWLMISVSQTQKKTVSHYLMEMDSVLKEEFTKIIMQSGRKP